MNARKIKVFRRIRNGNDKSCLHLTRNDLTKPKPCKPLVDGVDDTRVACPLLCRALGKIFRECTLCGIDGLYGRGKAHLPRLLETLVLHDEIRVVGTDGIALCHIEEALSREYKGKSRHALNPFLGRGHADINIHLIHGKRDHGKGRDGVRDHDGAVRVGARTDLLHGVQDPRPRLLMRRVDGGNVWIFLQRPLDGGEIGQRICGEREVDMRHAVSACHLGRSRRVRAVIDDEEFLARRHEGADAGIHTDGAGTAKEDGRPLRRIGLYDTQKICAECAHERAELPFTRTDIRNELRRLNGICCRSRAGI